MIWRGGEKMSGQIYDMELIAEEQIYYKYDYLVLAPNVEKRSRHFFLKHRDIFSKIIIIDYANFHKNISEEQEKNFYEDFKNVSHEIVRAKNDKDAIQQLCKAQFDVNATIAIDITGFSIPNIYCFMNALKNVIHIKQLDVFYTEPKFYIYEEGYFDAYHGRVKERKCAPILGYCNSGEDENEILTIFLGFDGGLADMVYFKLGEEGKEILKTYAVNGFPSYTAKLKDVSLFNNEGLINKIGRENVLCTTANNPFETYNLLCGLITKCKEGVLNLCTIGSKPMALGTCLFALDHHSKVKVTYPFYEKTKFDVDEEPGKTWRYGISF